ncbi:MAG: hypothetical protein SFV54_18635 [Bryobacteraceae bacterium]|nr:hypothetical protein [Bryobacteraceae bacterium]
MKVQTLFWLASLAAWAQRPDLHVIEVVDESTKRGVPLVELCATSGACFLTDSAGLVALQEPSFWGQDVYFSIRGHGYEHAKDFFGDPGRSIRVTRGGSTRVTVTRVNIAERLYRVTGEGIYRDSVIAGRKRGGRPLLNANVTGLDTVMHTVYRGRLFWLFGDTNNLSASLGNLATTCARSLLPGKGGLDPEAGIDLAYFEGKGGFVKPMAAIPGPGMKWMFALMVVRDAAGVERLVARYDRMKSLEEAYDTGLAVFDDERQEFRPIVSFGTKPAIAPYGRPTRVSVDGKDYFYFSSPHPTPVVRVKAEWEAVQDLSRYEALSCDSTGCGWGAGGKPERVRFVDVDSGKPVEAETGSVQWNEYRRRWVAILQKNVGEVWYAEADTPAGPWAYAKRIVQHQNYTFYWPGQIAEFDTRGGRRIYFMGTYTQSFSGNPVKTPRYDYNQILYALSLDDPRMALPVAAYRVRGQAKTMVKEELDRLGLWKDVEAVSHYELGTRRLENPDGRLMLDWGARASGR